MTAFLFIPTPRDTKLARRVDFANIASLFTEADEPASAHAPRGLVTRAMAMVLILLFAVGDSILVARPDALSRCFATHQTTGTPNG